VYVIVIEINEPTKEPKLHKIIRFFGYENKCKNCGHKEINKRGFLFYVIIDSGWIITGIVWLLVIMAYYPVPAVSLLDLRLGHYNISTIDNITSQYLLNQTLYNATHNLTVAMPT
jgi:hypothetical protein